MFDRHIPTPTMELATNRFEEPIQVDLQSYFEFCFWISEELLDLEARFAEPGQRPAKVYH